MRSDLGSAETVRTTDVTLQVVDRLGDIRRLDYDVYGIRLSVTSDLDDVLAIVDATYAAFRVPDLAPAGAAADDPFRFSLIDLDGTGPCRLDSPDGRSERLASPTAGLFGLLEGMVGTIVARLHGLGILAAHAGAVAGRSGAIVIAGRSGQGKTTLVLGLARAGLGLLSDELALLDPAADVVRPYRRAVHIRPSTLGLLPELAPLGSRPLDELGGGSEWTVSQAEIVGFLGGSLAEARPLGGVVLLEGTPDPSAEPRIVDVPPAVAAIELMRSTWAASVDFGGTLEAVGQMLAGVPCLRLSVGRFEPTVAAVWARLGSAR
jgi:hypothetical protein